MKDAETGKWVANADDKYKWESNHELMAANAVRPLPDAGFPVTLPVRTQRIEPISAVSVSPGATLKADIRDGGAVVVAGLILDGDKGIGSFENITFAEEGTVDVRNIGNSVKTFAPALTGCTGFENLAGWSVLKNGVPTSNSQISVENGTIRVYPAGMVILIR